MAIPRSSLPGFAQLRKNIETALGMLTESHGLDFKESSSWDSLKIRLVRECIAMANLRDGGMIIIGVSERSHEWQAAGVSERDLESYDVDEMKRFVNVYASPPIDMTVVVHEADSRRFLVLHVSPFAESPIVCSKSHGSELQQAAVYVRPIGVAEATKISNEMHMRDLLDLAAEKRAKRMLETVQRLGSPAASANRAYDDELGSIWSDSSKEVRRVLDHPNWRLVIRPREYEKRFDRLARCEAFLKDKAVSLRGWPLPYIPREDSEKHYGTGFFAGWTAFGGIREYWRLHQSAQFVHINAVREVVDDDWRRKIESNVKHSLARNRDLRSIKGHIDNINALYYFAEAIEFASRMASSDQVSDEVDLSIELVDCEDFVLVAPITRFWPWLYQCRDKSIRVESHIEPSMSQADTINETIRVFMMFCERFGWTNPSEPMLRGELQSFLSGGLR